MAKFLPPEASGVVYSIQNSAETSFGSEAAGFLKEIAQKMAVEAVHDTGRIPSLMSRAYNFYIDLFPDNFAGGRADERTGRDVAQKRARRAFRGILSVLALRDALGLEIELRKFPDVDVSTTGGSAYRPVFMESYGEAPEFGKPAGIDLDERGPGQKAPAGTGPWQQLRYLVVRMPVRKAAVAKDESGQDKLKVDYSEEPLCGLSPFTLFFPAGAMLRQCNNIFWYKQTFDDQGNQTGGEWLDPTTDWTGNPSDKPPLGVSYEIIKSIRGHLARWLELVLQGDPQGVWKAFGLRGRAQMLEDELNVWLAELHASEHAPEPDYLRVEAAPLALNIMFQGLAANVPLLEQKAAWGAQKLQKLELPGLVSELPRMHGRVLLSTEILGKAGLRVCGGLMGSESLTASLKSLPPEGTGFVVYKGDRGYYVPDEYVIVDRLFYDNLHLVADGPLSDQFFAMKTGGTNDELWWLLPFRPELLPYLDLNALRRRNADIVKCVRAGGPGENYLEVTVVVGGQPFKKRYPWNSVNRDMQGNALDLRIWPNFRFNNNPKLPAVDEDRVHYFRIRHQLAWDLHFQILARSVNGKVGETAEVRPFPPKVWDANWPETLEPQHFRSAYCYAFPARGTDIPMAAEMAPNGAPADHVEWEPLGVMFKDRGLCLFLLEAPAPVPPGRPSNWRIAVDFGTSNTCVAYAVDAPGVNATPTHELRFEVQTISLHAYPKYEQVDEALAQGRETEGAAAVLDFPYKYATEKFVTEAAYFPTQWLTRLPDGAPPDNTAFLMSNGLIFARNLLDFTNIVQLLRDYPPAPLPDRRPFHVVPDPKWANQPYRPAFIRHLYRMIVYHAARSGAQITSASFSFPRAFFRKEVDAYRNEIYTIFHDEAKIGSSGLKLITESEAVQNLLTAGEILESPLVLDVGGGTTDLLGIFQGTGFQASYKFAAGMVNEYFAASVPLQHMFEEVLWKVIKEEEKTTVAGGQQAARKKLLKDLFTRKDNQYVRPDYILQGFFRMLGMLSDRHYPALVDELQRLGEAEHNEANRKALTGFFHTVALLYTGMVYQAGRLMRFHNIGVANIKVRLIGNGSRFYRFLSHRSSEFDRVMQNMLWAGYQSKPEFRIVLEPEGKTLVAKGLLAPAKGVRAQVTQDPESHDYLLKLAQQPPTAPASKDQFEALMQKDLFPFLDALNSEIPSGQLDGSTVIPFCEPSLIDELRRLVPSINTAVWGEELRWAKSLKEDWDDAMAKPDGKAASSKESAFAAEPVFITRLKCLIAKIRDVYANPR